MEFRFPRCFPRFLQNNQRNRKVLVTMVALGIDNGVNLTNSNKVSTRPYENAGDRGRDTSLINRSRIKVEKSIRRNENRTTAEIQKGLHLRQTVGRMKRREKCNMRTAG